MTVIGIDLGVDGGIAVVRAGREGPELCCPPQGWSGWKKANWHRYALALPGDFAALVQRWAPAAVAIEDVRSLMHRRDVGVAQAKQAGFLEGLAAQHRVRVIRVGLQTRDQAERAWAILRGTCPGAAAGSEHVRDACAVALAGLGAVERQRPSESKRD